MSTAFGPLIQLFVRGPQFLFNTNGSSIQLSDSTIPYEYYNDGSSPDIKTDYVSRDANWKFDVSTTNFEASYKETPDGITNFQISTGYYLINMNDIKVQYKPKAPGLDVDISG